MNRETYEQLTNSIMKTNGITSAEALTERIKAGDITFNTKQKMLLGKLKGATTAARFHPYIESCARVILLDVDRVVKRYDAFGMTDANGKALTVTKEEILSGIDESLLEKAKTGTLTKAEAKTLNLSIRKALSENTVLSTLATADAVGGILMNTGKFTQAAMQDESLINVEDIDHLNKHGTPEQKQAFADSLGIEDLSKTTFNEVRKRIAQKRGNVNPSLQATAMQAQPMEQKTPATSTNFEKVQAAGDNTRGVASLEDMRYAFKGRAADGKGIYESNFPKGTPKSAKSKKILDYITNVWSKKPIRLVISNGETSRVIFAQFDPFVDASQNMPTDASKLAGGNRHGNHTEQRVTLDLADDYYQIASEATYNYSKEETGKNSATHSGVKMWHYFVNDIYFSEQGEIKPTPYTVTINVKEKANGNFVYSFNAEKTKEHSTRQTLHAAVNARKGANGELFIDSIPENAGKSNTFSENSSEISSDDGTRRALSEKATRNSEKSTENTENSTSSMTAEEIDAYARENIDEYRQLNEPSKAAVRMTIREARASGLTETQTLTYAKVAARSGLNIIFDAKRAVGDGSIKGNTIYINPKNSETRTREVILGHEMFHRLFATGGKKAMRLYREAWKLLPKEKRTEVRTRYQEFYIEQKADPISTVMISEEEVAAAGAEEVFKIADVWEYLLGEEPTLADKVVRFFYASARKYSGIDGMPAAARKFIRHYKKLFTELSERQQGTNALSLALEGQNTKKAPVRSINSKKMHVTGDKEEIDRQTDANARYALDVDMDSKVRYNDIKNKEGTGIKNASSKNSKVLGGRSISTSHRGADGVWKQGYDPEEVYKRLADCQNGKGRQGETRTGHSGWLRDSQGNKLSILRLRKGFLRDLQRRQLSGKDTAGRDLSPLIQKKFSNSVFKDENGNLLSMYHWTSAKFRDFAKGDTGFHFGTLQAAYIRYTQKSKKNWISNSFYKECYVNMKNPVFIDFDTISWDVFPTAHKLKQENVISDEELALLEKKEGYYHTKYDSLAAVVLRNMLAEKGYDGIIYTNYNEGDISVMVLNPDQIYTVAENGIDVDHKDFRYALPETAPRPDSDKKVTDGAMAKKVADLTKKTVYSRKSALEVINRIMENEKMSAGTLNDLTDEVWRGLNACNTLRQKQDFARDMAAFIVQKMYAESEAQNPKAKEAQALLMRLRVGIRKITFGETDIAEIKAAGKTLGIEAKQLQSILARWRKWNARKTLPVGSDAQVSKPELYTMQEFVNDVIETVPHMDTLLHGLSPAQALLEINSRYERAKTDAQNEWINKYDDASDTEMFAMIQSVEQALLDAFATSGERSKLTKITERQKASFEKRLEEYRNQITVFRESGNILSRIKSLDMKQFCNKTQYKSQVLKNSVEQLKKIEHRKNLNRSGTRRILRGLNEWYNEENPMLDGRINNYVKMARTE